MNQTLYTALTLIIPLVFAIVFHEISHGLVANMLGDPTARERRRLSLNPFRHVDPVGTVLLPGALALAHAPVFGWAKPVPVDFSRLRNPRVGMMLVAAAGPGSNLVLATLSAVALGLLARTTIGPVTGFIAENLANFIQINLFLALFNLLPIPPFDGSHILEGLLPPSAARTYARLRPYGMAVVLGLIVVLPMLFPQAQLIQRVVLPPVLWLWSHLLHLAGMVAGSGVGLDSTV